MTALATALDTALQADCPLIFGAVEIILPGGPLRLLDGPAAGVTINSNAYTDLDATYGTLGSVESFSDGSDNTAPSLKLSLFPPTNTAMATLAAPAAQGSQVSLWFGAIDRISGAVIASPYLVFFGQLDVPTVQIGKGIRYLDYEIISGFELFFDQDEGVRLNGPWHVGIWSGETGLQFVTTNNFTLPWGADAARPVIISDLRPIYGAYAGAGAGQGQYYNTPTVWTGQ